MKRIRFCQECDKYTLKVKCGTCGGDTIINAPYKYTRDEEVAKYRREAKKEVLIKKGLL